MTKPGDLHPYDGEERRFCDDDIDSEARARGAALAARLLKLSALPPAALRYDLSFYSGGIGVIDRLHIALPCTPAEVDAIVCCTGMCSSETLQASDEDREAFEWLVLDEEQPDRSLDVAVVTFIDAHRRPFQPRPRVGCRAWFSPGSDVNAWSLVYEVDGALAFIAYVQG